ncbi:aldehyde dehydrogenase family protein [Dactylosporangium sp. NPDC049742]|uniref:aldehyde dehydrogenase family protein n=1 Tax=Dactylosporangium sp. NPDC049742 TaxID=3154737 RepID=UPI0034332C2A
MRSVQSRSPQQPDDVVVTVPAAGMGGVVAAVERARLAQREWGGCRAGERAAALTEAAGRVHAARDELIALAVREVGKPITEATAEVDRTVAILRYYAQQVFDPAGAVHEPTGTGLLYTRRRPLGVAGLITPWNFPFAIPLWKAAPALAAGNAVVLKPAPQATACAMRLFELLAGPLPDGLVEVVPGHASEGQVLTSTTDVVSFTGSVQAGTVVAARAVTTGVPVQAEMGGHNPAIVLPDADLDRAARHIVAAAYGYAGQKCTATRRIIGVGAASEPLREALLMAIDELPCGDPGDPKTMCGPVIDDAARGRMLAAAREARQSGGTVLAGGTASDNLVAPILVGGLSEGHALARHETFGPFCLLQSAADVPTAVAMANSGAYGLVSAVYTTDLGHALRFVEELGTGLVKVNAPSTGVDFHLPFGGVKASSYGPPEQGKAAMDFYTTVRTVTVQPG